MYILIRKNIISNLPCSPKMLFVIKCVVITLELCISCAPDPPVLAGDGIGVSIVFKPKRTDPCGNARGLAAVLGEPAAAVLRGHSLRRGDRGIAFAQVCLVRTCSVCVPPPCSALYDDVMVLEFTVSLP